MNLPAMEKLAQSLEDVGPLDLKAEEVKPLWFVHPEYATVFSKIGLDLKGRVVVLWITLDDDRETAIVLSMREANDEEKKLFRHRTGH
jgi:hypothetical protein